MPIQYNVIERPQPGVKGGGIKKWYATIASSGELSIDDLAQRIEKFSALSEADIKGVIIALENVMQEALSDGYIVRMDKMGSFYPTLSSGSADTEKAFHAGLIKQVDVNYRAGKRILDAMKAAGVEKASKDKK